MQFGEYLVKRKILSAHHILKALAEQRRRRKFLPLLMVELNVLADYRSLRYCTAADQNSEDFLDFLLREGIISKPQFSQLQTTWMQSGPPLGQLLVEMGFLDNDTLECVLEEFAAEKALEEMQAELSRT